MAATTRRLAEWEEKAEEKTKQPPPAICRCMHGRETHEAHNTLWKHQCH